MLCLISASQLTVNLAGEMSKQAPRYGRICSVGLPATYGYRNLNQCSLLALGHGWFSGEVSISEVG